MTVKTLIRQLQKLPADAEVIIPVTFDYQYDDDPLHRTHEMPVREIGYNDGANRVCLMGERPVSPCDLDELALCGDDPEAYAPRLLLTCVTGPMTPEQTLMLQKSINAGEVGALDRILDAAHAGMEAEGLEFEGGCVGVRLLQPKAAPPPPSGDPLFAKP